MNKIKNVIKRKKRGKNKKRKNVFLHLSLKPRLYQLTATTCIFQANNVSILLATARLRGSPDDEFTLPWGSLQRYPNTLAKFGGNLKRSLKNTDKKGKKNGRKCSNSSVKDRRPLYFHRAGLLL